MSVHEKIDTYHKLEKEIFEHVGYKHDWSVFPIDDSREMFWHVDPTEQRQVRFAKTEEALQKLEGEFYENEIYTYYHLKKWVYRGKEITLIVVDTHTDGNKYVQIFDNTKERPWVDEESLAHE